MSDKKERGLYTVFTQWGLSYIVISIVALLVIFFCSTRYTKALHEEQDYINTMQLEITQSQIDQDVRNLRTFANKANLNDTVNALRKMNSYEDISRYELYLLVKELANEMIIAGEINDCYLYFPDLDLLISTLYYSNSRQFYDISFGSYGIDYEDWHDIIDRDYRTSQVFSLDTKNGDPLTILIKPLDSRSRIQHPVNAIMILDMNKILRSSEWLDREQDSIGIIDRTNRRIVFNDLQDEDFSDSLLNLSFGEQADSFETQYEVGSSVVSFIRSQYENWEYAVITKQRPFVTQINQIQHLVWFLVGIYLIVSICAIVYGVLRHYRPMHDVMTVLEKHNAGEETDTADAYQYISQSVHKLVDQNKENTNLISKQRSAISRELIHRLLTEKEGYNQLDEELLQTFGINVGDNFCMIIAYRLHDADESTEELSEENREMFWFILRNVTSENLSNEELKWTDFQEEVEQVFLIWTDKDAEIFEEETYKAWENSNLFINEHFKFNYHSAMSEVHCGITEVWKAYREVECVFEHQKNDENANILCYRDINLLPDDTFLKYPIDVENRLIFSVENGNGEAACKEISNLLEENQSNFLEPESMRFLISNITSSIMRGAEEVLKGRSFNVSQKKLRDACRLEDIEGMRKELENFTIEVCREVSETGRQERDNQKGDLYDKAKAYVDLNYYDTGLNVNSMAVYFGITPTQLSKLFKEMSGGKLSQYISKVRLDHVKEMLLKDDTDIRLEDIAQKCGFGSQRTFLRIFKQYEGVTPSQYKEIEEKKQKKNN